jgi:hypothetical protein
VPVDVCTLPSHGEIVQATHDDSIDAAQYDAERAERYARRDGFY